ncbi:MAG: response regulator [Desulfitobacteriaceae bacterium]|nr:response regulator [Desulfitobacteriaceae bacterium]
MKVWLIDDEQPCLDELGFLLSQYRDLKIIGSDTNPSKALETIVKNPPDAVFLDIDMPKMDGLTLALAIQEHCPGIIVIFITAYSHYALEAYKTYPLDYLLKPIRQERLDDCVVHLRKHFALLHSVELPQKKFAINCFGAFELTCGTEIKWRTHRVRDMLLYLVGCNGYAASKQELLNVLFGGQSDKSTVHNLHMTFYRLRNLLDIIDPSRELIQLTKAGALMIAPGICDYTDFMCFARENSIITDDNMMQAEHVLSLYRGMYLEKEDYEWSNEITSEAEVEYERIALGLNSVYIAAGRFEDAVHILKALLLHNSLCEEAHAFLLDMTLETGDHDAFLQHYERYAHILKKELDLKPASYYQKQYDKIKRLKGNVHKDLIGS